MKVQEATARAPTLRTTLVPGSSAVRPLLKWAGGKRWQVRYLRPLWRRHERRRLVEPFCGGVAVATALMPKRALLNDINPHLINFYRWLARGLVVTLNMSNDERIYYQHRRRFNQLLAEDGAATSEAAALFYYLNRTGYNGLCRFNQQGEFNVPFGRYKRISYMTDFTAYREAFSGWEFTAGDFEAMKVEADDFIYADPPYDTEFTSYAKEVFTWDDQERAAKWLARHPGPVVLCNQATDRIVALYEKLGFNLRFLEGPRMISCTGDRTPDREVLALKNL